VKVAFFFKEAVRALRRSAAPSFAAMLTILITALVLGVFIPVVQATTGTANEVRGRVVVDVFVKPSATDAQKAQLHQELLALPNVKSVQYISKQQALKTMQRRNREAFALLGNNPLPDSFRLVPRNPDGVNAIADNLAPRAPAIDGGQRRPRLPAIDEVRNRKQDTNKILSATGLVKLVTAGLAILFTLASIALVANTIRLSIFARRREVEVMKLVGATNWFIRWPFVIEGVIVGFMAGVLAILLLTVAKETFIDPLSERFALLAAPNTIDFPLLAGLLLLACVGISALGSGLTLRRFLRV
jgi:cell division transport system permease protein